LAFAVAATTLAGNETLGDLVMSVWAGLVVVPLVPVFGISSAFLSWELAIAAAFFEISVESVPPGRWAIDHLALSPFATFELHNRTGLKLSHGLAYGHPVAVAQTCTWLRERVIARRMSGRVPASE
jgi:hypothetical protein